MQRDQKNTQRKRKKNVTPFYFTGFFFLAIYFYLELCLKFWDLFKGKKVQKIVGIKRKIQCRVLFLLQGAQTFLVFFYVRLKRANKDSMFICYEPKIHREVE